MGSDVEKPPLVVEINQQPKELKSAKPRRDYLHSTLSLCTGICAVLCMVAHCLAITVGPKLHDLTGYLQQALRVYGIAFSIIVLVIETEWQPVLAKLQLLDSWLWRGFFQLFLGVLTLELSRSTAQGQTDVHKSLRLYRMVAGYSLLSCSGLYILCGALCWGRQKAKVRYQREAERQRVEEDLDALDQKRQELKGLLAMYSNH